MTGRAIKRFYQSADVVESAEPGFVVALDGRPVRSPGGRPLALASRPLAEVIAGEWRAQGETVVPTSMPLTQLACTALDRVIPERRAVIAGVAAYGGSDLLCHRADGPAELVSRQRALWQPPLDWAADALGVGLTVTTGIVALDQPAEALARLGGHLDALDDLALTAVAQIAGTLGSVVLALALAHGRLDAEAAVAAGFLDEDFQADRWGRDDEAEARRAAMRGEILAADRLLKLIDWRPPTA